MGVMVKALFKVGSLASGELTRSPITISMPGVIFGQTGNHIAPQALGKTRQD